TGAGGPAVYAHGAGAGRHAGALADGADPRLLSREPRDEGPRPGRPLSGRPAAGPGELGGRRTRAERRPREGPLPAALRRRPGDAARARAPGGRGATAGAGGAVVRQGAGSSGGGAWGVGGRVLRG